MKLYVSLLTVALAAILIHLAMEKNSGAETAPTMSFFVTSAKSKTGNLGGLNAADSTCQKLAAAVGQGNKTWRAYLSADRDPENPNQPVHARDRIGSGPWHNAHGVLVAKDLDELHARKGDPKVFVDEHGQPVPGNWPGSPRPNEHDILTGSTREGRLMAGKTCGDWKSEGADVQAQVGHADGIGRAGDTSDPAAFWNSVHESQNCADTAPRGGAGRFYCFAR